MKNESINTKCPPRHRMAKKQLHITEGRRDKIPRLSGNKTIKQPHGIPEKIKPKAIHLA